MPNKFLFIFLMMFASSHAFSQSVLPTVSDSLRARQSNLNALEYVFDEDEIPESMNQEMEDLLRDYNAQHYLFVDSDCVQMPSGPIFTKEETIERLRSMPTFIEMPWNEVVQNYIDRYANKLRRHVSLMLGAQNLYMEIFEEALETYGLPLELRYLPVIESALNPNAVSHAGAGGLWQFMVATGQRYGLRVNSLVDERRDPTKSSYAAAHYLYDLYQIFNDWHLVIAAYNAGPGNIQKAITRAGGSRDYWEIYPFLPAETRGYVPAFIAANYIMTFYRDHNICPMKTTLPQQADTIVVTRNLHFKQISEVIGIPIEELRAFNPQYRHDIVTGYTEPTDLRMPTEYVKLFIANEDSIWAYDVSNLMKRDQVEVRSYTATRSYSRHSSRKSSKSAATRKSSRKRRR
jgi:membrane-bound lytic murein transglycosylase D